jgi:hypothetical protein
VGDEPPQDQRRLADVANTLEQEKQ